MITRRENPPHFFCLSNAWCIFLSQSSTFVQQPLKMHQQDTLGDKLLHYEEHGRCCLFWGDPLYTILLLTFTITSSPAEGFRGPPFVQLSSNTRTKGLGDLHRELFLDVVQEEERVDCSIPPRAGYKSYPSFFKGMDAFLGSNTCTAVATWKGQVWRYVLSLDVTAGSGELLGVPLDSVQWDPRVWIHNQTSHSGERCHQNSHLESESQRKPVFNMAASFINALCQWLAFGSVFFGLLKIRARANNANNDIKKCQSRLCSITLSKHWINVGHDHEGEDVDVIPKGSRTSFRNSEALGLFPVGS